MKKNEIMPFVATWSDPEMIILSEVSQTEKDKYHEIDYMWNLKKWYKWTLFTKWTFIYKTKANSQTEKTNLWLDYQRESLGERDILEFGINIYILLYVKVGHQKGPAV